MWLGEEQNQARAEKPTNEIQNRCILRKGRRKRVRKLWNQWHSQAGFRVNQTPSSVFVHSTSVHQSYDNNENEIADVVCDGSIFYDSDPEYRTGHQRASESRINCSWTINSNISFGTTSSDKISIPHLKSTPSDIRVLGSFLRTESYDFLEDEEAKEFLQEFILGKISLVWHPRGRKSNREFEALSPVSVTGSFENGVRLPATIVQPKFIWAETCRPESKQHSWRSTCLVPNSMEILSMVRIIKPKNLNRLHYPFAKTNLAFLITCHDGKSHLFEARSSRERDIFVFGLKLLVARLASKILVGDESVFTEFYNPFMI